MKKLLLCVAFLSIIIQFISAQECIDTVTNGLTIQSKTSTTGTDCLFTISFCVRKTGNEADHLDFAVYHSGGEMYKTIDLTSVSVGSVVCELFTFVADCNSTASFVAVGKEASNSVCGAVVQLISLPIQLLSFTAEIQNPGQCRLIWVTAFESNSSHFIIQQSNDGRTFQDMARVNAAGESVVPLNYSSVINTGTITGTNAIGYYRLKMVDKDQSFTYSQILRTRKSGTPGFRVYPNPVLNSLQILSSGLLPEDVRLFDLNGRQLSTSWLGDNELDLSMLRPGVYFLRYQDEIAELLKL